MNGTRLLVCGSRGFPDRWVEERLEPVLWDDLAVLIHGACRGPDLVAAAYIARRAPHVEILSVPAQWDKHGRGAGIRRNAEMILLEPDYVLAFWDGASPGTLDMIRRAAKAGVLCEIVPIPRHEAP